MNIDEPIIGYPNVKAMLEDLYIAEGLTMNDIALRCNVSLTTITNWVHECDIPARPRGGGNNKSRYGRTLHLLDQRIVMSTPNKDLERILGINYSTIYKYKREVKATWNFA